MSLFYIVILVVASASALPIRRYSDRNNYGYEIASLNEPLLVAASAPKNFAGKTEESGYYKTFGTDADGEKGFESGRFSNGKNGYKELDTFHKQIGDKYGFEENSEFGYDEEDDQSGAEEKKNDADGAGTIVDSYYAGSGEYSGDGGSYLGSVDSDNYNQEYSSGNSGEGTYSSYSQKSNDGDTASSGEYDY